MENQFSSANFNSTMEDVKQLKQCIIQHSKHIKSNDETFQLSTLPKISKDVVKVMNSYVETIRRIEASQKAITDVQATIEQDSFYNEDDDIQEEFLDDNAYKVQFHACIEEELASSTREENAKLELDRLLFNNVDIVEEVNQFTIPKDPITQQEIVTAVKSSKCKHIYDKDGIYAYFRQKEANKKQVRCPHIGCTNKNMSRSEIVPDEDTNRKIQELRRNGT